MESARDTSERGEREFKATMTADHGSYLSEDHYGVVKLSRLGPADLAAAYTQFAALDMDQQGILIGGEESELVALDAQQPWQLRQLGEGHLRWLVGDDKPFPTDKGFTVHE
jgi:hypothetical protein